ncbi:hypothetical protein J5N97_026189 [Dioscorea zingiberensis]|uniref:Uncharacterized protein n=1 Tax=Dioscorea zingiberensis TaxID=325984 RepID=A0A9D5C1U9_9LILI|nr:hypothetical protein J5N97_026189 [Dioscorea zingiberensis]
MLYSSCKVSRFSYKNTTPKRSKLDLLLDKFIVFTDFNHLKRNEAVKLFLEISNRAKSTLPRATIPCEVLVGKNESCEMVEIMKEEKSSLNEKKDNTHCIVAMLSPLVGTPLGAQTLLGTVTFPAVTGPASTAMPPAMLLAWPSSKTPLLAPSPIPPAIGNLRYLQVVRLHKLPNLYSTIPPEIAKLSNLRFLTISWTGVYGSVPSFLANLTALEQLDLSFNKLSGFIPSSLGDLETLLHRY